MGCDIHSFAEVKRDGHWVKVGAVFPLNKYDRERRKKEFGDAPFDWRGYGMFGFLAGVRNYSHCPTIAEPRYSLPEDVSGAIKEAYGDDSDWHTTTWLTLRQLNEFDYDQVFWNRRITKQTATNCWDGAALAEEGEGEHLPIRAFLGEDFFRDLAILNTLGAPDDVRVVFWFDN